MLKTVVRTTACLAMSAAVIIAVTKLDAFAGQRRKSETETAAPEAASPPRSTAPKPAPKPPAPAPAAPKLTAAKAAIPTTTAPTAAATKTDGAGLLEMPDWKGKRLSVARRDGRKMGLKVTAVDESGESVPAELASEYRVRRILTRTGSAVQLVVREIFDAAEGY